MLTDVSNGELQKARIMMTSMFVKRRSLITAENKVELQDKLVLTSLKSKKQVFVVIASDRKT